MTPTPLPPVAKATGIETDPSAHSLIAETHPTDPEILFPGRHFRLTAVTLSDGSDLRNELVQESEWLLHPNETLRLRGNLFCLELLETAQQVILLLPEPLPHARPEPSEVDLTVVLDRHTGVHLQTGPGDWVQLCCGAGPVARARTLQRWQRQQRPDTPIHQRANFLSNTWGDRSRDGRMSHTFIAGEIEAAGRLGVDVVQLDDGWQRGITVNSTRAAEGGVWEGFWHADPRFWTPHPQRFPEGLEPLVKLAAAQGVVLGLWFAPDSWNDFVHWEKDADTVLGFYRNWGVRQVKIDGIKVHSALGLRNLRSFIDKVLRESQGEVAFDLDITAETRPGHLGMMSCGPLFVENRYTDWLSYWPHFTLRTVWQLTRWIDPLRLRMEFLNPLRNQALYENDPLGPATYPPETLFATVMCVNPLGWFEVTGLSDPVFAALQPLVNLWRQHRDRMAACTLVPIGGCPDGHNFSGFLMLPPEGSEGGYLLLFRGITAADTAEIPLPTPISAVGAVLAGRGSAACQGTRLQVSIPECRAFLFARL